MKSWVMVGVNAKELHTRAVKAISERTEDKDPVVLVGERHLDAYMLKELLEELGVN